MIDQSLALALTKKKQKPLILAPVGQGFCSVSLVFARRTKEKYKTINMFKQAVEMEKLLR